MDDKDFLSIMQADKDIFETIVTGLIEDVFPYLHTLFPSAGYTRMEKLLSFVFDWINMHIAQHKQSFKPGIFVLNISQSFTFYSQMFRP